MNVLILSGAFLIVLPAIGLLCALIANYFRGDIK